MRIRYNCTVGSLAGLLSLWLYLNGPASRAQSTNIADAIPAQATIGTFTMKGFYIGMPREAVYTMLDKLRIRHSDILDTTGTRVLSSACGVGEEHGQMLIYYDHNDRLFEVKMMPAAVDALFNASSLGLDDFAAEFKQAYNLREMAPLDETVPSTGWKYKNEEKGFEIIIYLDPQPLSHANKTLIFSWIPLKSERKFN